MSGGVHIEYFLFEGYDIWDALNHAIDYFENDYDRMIKEYEEYPDEFITI